MGHVPAAGENNENTDRGSLATPGRVLGSWQAADP